MATKVKTRKKQALEETARNAITGYTAIILGLVCFIIVLMVVMAVVRFVVGLSLTASNNTTAAQNAAAAATATTTALVSPETLPTSGVNGITEAATEITPEVATGNKVNAATAHQSDIWGIPPRTNAPHHVCHIRIV